MVSLPAILGLLLPLLAPKCSRALSGLLYQLSNLPGAEGGVHFSLKTEGLSALYT